MKCSRWCRIKRRIAERLPGQSIRKCKEVIDDDVGHEENNDDNSNIIMTIMTFT